MEEVPAHVHPGPIVPDVLTRQHEHRSGLIWNASVAIHFRLTASVHGSFRGCMTDRGSPSPTSDLGLVAYSCIAVSATLACSQDPLAPLGAIWCTAFDFSQLPTHVLLTYRDQLDVMSFDQVWL
ncbi:hypothetical protein M9H77_29949 [Catharanthus roseus]|uniref:Uncharacterized protein n=1 Tax=Catharanthus roseus TaxID=4058 RepID=A0ACB9ZX68_CATRO|nr:hypothetical protein M9H77_29949 [Catharanthus roseus]